MGDERSVKVGGLLDPGSNRIFRSHTLIDRLGICGTPVKLNLETLIDGEDITVSFKVLGKG